MSDRLPEPAELVDSLPSESLPAIIAQAAAIQARAAARLADEARSTSGDKLGQYVSIAELVRRSSLAEQTIRNLMNDGQLLEGEHYFRPCGRVVFSWPDFERWMRDRKSGRARERRRARGRQG